MTADLLKGGQLIAKVQPRREWKSIDPLPRLLALTVEHVVIRLHRQAEEVDAGIKLSAPQVRVLDVAKGDDPAIEQGQLEISIQEVEVENIDATDRQGKVE